MKQRFLLLACATLFVAASNLTIAQGYKPGDKARDFKLKNIDGSMMSLSDMKSAKGYIVVFTCNHCPFSVKYEDRIIALDKKYKELGYPVVAINPNDDKKEPDDSYEKMIARHKEKGFTFPYLHDATQEIAKAYGASRTPHVYVLRKVGSDLVVEYIGAIDDNANDANTAKTRYVENAIEELLANKKVSQSATKAIGCTVKWKDA
jgi:peroxiredoxin